MLLEHLLSSSGAGPPLRVALLLDGSAVPRSYAEVVEHIRRSDFARLVLVVHEERPPAALRPGPLRLLTRFARPADRARLLFDLYERWDRRRSGADDDPVEAIELCGAVAGVPSVSIEARAEGDVVALGPEALERLKEHRLDVAIRFARGHLRDDAVSLARHGVWSFHQGDEDAYRGGPAHFWELAEQNPLSGVSLEARRAPAGARVVLCKGLAATALEHSELSLARNRVKPQRLGATFVIRKLKQLHEHGFAALERDAVRPAPYRGKRERYHTPSNLELAAFLVPRLAGKARGRLLRSPKLVQWRVGVRVRGAPSLAAGRPLELDGFRWLEAPRGRLHADPCLIEREGQVYCFFEDLDHARHLGRISCAAVDADGRLREIRPALELPYHLSYPFVFEDRGDVFMVPESRRNGTVDLFRAVEFPGRWEKVRTLLAGPGLDTTVLRHGGRYWFFVAVREPDEAGEQLLLFHADSLDGELRFHPRNPISADVRTCRPGGAILSEGGRLLRPAQDCSVTYGHQLSFMEILALSPDEYREELVFTVPPPRGMEGIHTYGRCGAVEVVDGKRLEPVARHAGRTATDARR